MSVTPRRLDLKSLIWALSGLRVGIGASVGEETDDALPMRDKGLCDTLKIFDAAVLCSLDPIY